MPSTAVSPAGRFLAIDPCGNAPGTTSVCPPPLADEDADGEAPAADVPPEPLAVAASGLDTVTSFDSIGVVVARGTSDQIKAAGNEPGVTYLEGNAPIAPTDATSNIATGGAAVAANDTGANGQALDGSGVSVAVIDSGVDIGHPDLAPSIWTNPKPAASGARAGDVHGWDFCHNDATVYDADEYYVTGELRELNDLHGTHVAGTIAAANDNVGVVGVAPGVTIMPRASISSAPFSGTSPTRTITPSRIATSAARGSVEYPSNTVPWRTTTSMDTWNFPP